MPQDDLIQGLIDANQQGAGQDEKPADDDLISKIQQEQAPMEDPPQEPQEPEKPAEDPKPEPTKPPQEPQDPKTPEPSFDWSTLGEDFKDEESVKSFIENTKTVSKEKEELANKVKELESRNPFSDEMLFKLDHIKKTDPDKFDSARKLAFGEPDPLEVLKMQLESDSKAFRESSEEAKESYLRRQYKLEHNLSKLNPDEYSEEEVAARDREIREAEQEIDANKLKLKLDAENARNKLMDSMFSGIEVPKSASPEEIESQKAGVRQELEQSWDGVMDKVGLEKVSINALDPKSKSQNEFLSVEVPQSEVMAYKKELRDIMVNSGVDASTVPHDEVTGFIERRYREDHFPEIVHSVATKALEMGEDNLRKLFYNPSKKVEPSDPPPINIPDEKTTEAEIRRAMQNF